MLSFYCIACSHQIKFKFKFRAVWRFVSAGGAAQVAFAPGIVREGCVFCGGVIIQLSTLPCQDHSLSSQIERVNQCFETFLRWFCNEQPSKWNKCIPWAWYNTTFHASMSRPLLIKLCMEDCHLHWFLMVTKSTNNSAEQLLKDRDLTISFQGTWC